MMVQSYGLKMTPQRRVIVEFMETAHHHPTADEVFSAVNHKFPMTSRATVYNTLNWLRDAGLVREVNESGQVRFDPNNDPHHHFVCRVCGKVEDVDLEVIGKIQVTGLPTGYRVENQEVTLRGLCPNCQ